MLCWTTDEPLPLGELARYHHSGLAWVVANDADAPVVYLIAGSDVVIRPRPDGWSRPRFGKIRDGFKWLLLVTAAWSSQARTGPLQAVTSHFGAGWDVLVGPLNDAEATGLAP